MNRTYVERLNVMAVFSLALALITDSVVAAAPKYVAKCNYVAQTLALANGKKVNAGTTSEYNLCIQRRTLKGGLDTTFNVVGERIHADKAEVRSLEQLPSGNYLVKGLLTLKFVLFSWEVSPAGAIVGWAYAPAGVTPDPTPVDCSDPINAFLAECQIVPPACDPLIDPFCF